MSSVVKIDPEIMSEAPCFAGTRVPIQNLIEYLEGGVSTYRAKYLKYNIPREKLFS